MGGPGTLRQEGHPDDYRLWGNREYIRDSETTWVKLWVSWYELQQELGAAPGEPAGLVEPPQRCAGRARGTCGGSTRQVRAIKEDGLRRDPDA